MIASDSWIVTLLSNGKKEKGSAARYIGMILGKGITVNLFIPLNSTSFSNSYIYSDPRKVKNLKIESASIKKPIFFLL
jgi:Acetyl-coenzyme A transporter 1